MEQPIYELAIRESDMLTTKAESGKLLINPKAEEQILKLMAMQDYLDEAMEYVKKTIAEKSLEIDPDFSGVQSDSLRIMYRAYGKAFGIDESLHNNFPTEFLTEVKKINADKLVALCEENGIDITGCYDTSFGLNTKELEKHIKKGGELPYGVVKFNREKQLSITKKKAEGEE